MSKPICKRYSVTTAMTECQMCGHDLWRSNGTEPGVIIVLSIAGKLTEVPSVLVGGDLQDTEDGAVAKGFHSDTLCGRCKESLHAYEDA